MPTTHPFGAIANKEIHEPKIQVPLNLRLLGTVATEDRTHGIAIILADGSAKVFNVGDEMNDASLQYVYSDRVILNRRGSFETLMLSLAPTNSGSMDRSLLDITTDSSSDIKPQKLRNLGDAIKARASLDDLSGNVLGFMIEPSQVRRAFYDFGLRPRDLVTAVDGMTLIDQGRAHSQVILDEMLTASQAVITIVRLHGEPRDIALDISSWEPPTSPAILLEDNVRY